MSCELSQVSCELGPALHAGPNSRKESASRKRKRFARAPRGPLGGPVVNSATEKGYLSFHIDILMIFILKIKNILEKSKIFSGK